MDLVEDYNAQIISFVDNYNNKDLYYYSGDQTLSYGSNLIFLEGEDILLDMTVKTSQMYKIDDNNFLFLNIIIDNTLYLVSFEDIEELKTLNLYEIDSDNECYKLVNYLYKGKYYEVI